MQLPLQDRFVYTEGELKHRLATLLGGRAAEEVLYGTRSTGAHDDLLKATDLARRMVCDFGMSTKVGPIVYQHRDELRYLPSPTAGMNVYTSESSAKIIDEEVRAFVEEGLAAATKLLQTHREALVELTAELAKKEVMPGERVRERLARDAGIAAAGAR